VPPGATAPTASGGLDALYSNAYSGGVLTRRLAISALLCLALAACGETAEQAPTGPVVLAASSLQGSFEEVGSAWAAEGHAAPRLSFAATSALARQVEQGAPADLFVSADEDWMDALDRQGLLRVGTRSDILANRLVLVAKLNASVRRLADLGEGRLALADPAGVPAGKYAKAALEHLGLWQAVEARVVPAENVRAALALVERGEVALGIVYATDALVSDAVEVVETFPEDSHPPIRYPAAVLAGATHPEAEAFRVFLGSDRAQRIFARHGFGRIE
jgi:molybdate transport system substrate-binding protein